MIGGSLSFFAEKTKGLISDQPVTIQDLPRKYTAGTYYQPSEETFSILSKQKTDLTKKSTGQVSRIAPYFIGFGVGFGLMAGEGIEAIGTSAGRGRIRTERQELIQSGLSPTKSTIAAVGTPLLSVGFGLGGLKKTAGAIKTARNVKRAQTGFIATEIKGAGDTSKLNIFSQTKIGDEVYTGLSFPTIKTSSGKTLSGGESYVIKESPASLIFPRPTPQKRIDIITGKSVGIAEKTSKAKSVKDLGIVGDDFLTGAFRTQEKSFSSGGKAKSITQTQKGREVNTLIGGFVDDGESSVTGFIGGKPSRVSKKQIFQDGKLIPEKAIVDRPSVFGFIKRSSDKSDEGFSLLGGTQKTTQKPVSKLSQGAKIKTVQVVADLEAGAKSSIKIPSSPNPLFSGGVGTTSQVKQSSQTKTTKTSSIFSSQSLGQPQKTKTSQKGLLGVSQSSSIKQGTTSKLNQTQSQQPSLGSLLTGSQRSSQLTSQDTSQSLSFSFGEAFGFKTPTKTTTRLKPPTTTTPIIPRPKTPTGIFGIIPLEDGDEFRKSDKIGFNVEARIDSTKKRKSRWKKLNKKPQSRLGARDIGSRYVDKNLSAKFKISPIKQTKTVKGKKKQVLKKFNKPFPKSDGYFQSNQYKFRETRIKNKKAIATPMTFIEKKSYRLDSKNETKNIKKAKRKAQGYFRL